MNKRALLLGGAALVVTAAAGAGWWMSREQQTAAQASDVVLIDQNGAEVRWASLNATPRAVFFGFTHCPVICPVTVFELNDALEQVGANDVAIDFVSIDPERDTPERLRQYFSEFGPRIRAFTGAPEQIAALAKAFQVTYRRQEQAGGDYSMDHTATVFLLNTAGETVDFVAYGSPPEVMQERLRALAGTGS